MLDSDEQLFEWVGTLLDCKSALYLAAQGEDPRFARYHRRVYSAERMDDAGNKVYFWPDKWDEAELRAKEQELGAAKYAAEMQGRPISDQARIFVLSDLLNFYDLHDQQIIFHSSEDNVPRKTVGLSEWLTGLGRLTVVDLLHKVSATSDFSGVLTVGIDGAGTWWILDAWLGRVAGERVAQELWRQGVKWQSSVVAIESVAGQTYFREWMQSKLEADLSIPHVWSPRGIVPVHVPPRLAKEDRIIQMQPRVQSGRIKLPLHRMSEFAFVQLRRQLELFTADGKSLDYDDAVDMLSMVAYSPRVGPSGVVELPPTYNVLEMLADGQTTDPRTGLALFGGIDVSRIPPDIFKQLLDKTRERRDNESRKDDRAGALTRRLPRRSILTGRPAGER